MIILVPSNESMHYLLKFFELIRWKNLLIIVLTQYTARIFLIGETENFKEVFVDETQFLITLSTVLVAAAGYIINDYFDIKIDLINKPEKVIIGRYIQRRQAMLLHQLLNISAAVISFAISWKVFIVNILAITLLWVYASVFKKKPFIGNFMVAGLTAASLIVMAVYYNNDLLLNIYALFAFGITMIREIIKDMEDIRGDKRYGSTTLPIVWGIRKTKILTYAFMVLFVMAVIAMAFALRNKELLIAFLILAIPFAYIAFKLYFAQNKRDFAHLSLWSKILIVMGVLSMIFV